MDPLVFVFLCLKMVNGKQQWNIKIKLHLTSLHQQTFRSQSLETNPSTHTGFANMVNIQVRVDDQDTPQFSRLATLAGVSIPETDLLQSREQRQQRTQSRKDSRQSTSKGHKDCSIIYCIIKLINPCIPRVNIIMETYSSYSRKRI